MSDIAMKENVLYWIRVVILTLVLLFILISCTAWASPLSNSRSDAFADQEKMQSASGKGATLHQSTLAGQFRHYPIQSDLHIDIRRSSLLQAA